MHHRETPVRALRDRLTLSSQPPAVHPYRKCLGVRLCEHDNREGGMTALGLTEQRKFASKGIIEVKAQGTWLQGVNHLAQALRTGAR
jgi:hypothetical protein